MNRTVISQRLVLRPLQTQTLIMTPQLQQAIKMLQLSNLELTDFIDAEVQQNPLLERRERTPQGKARRATMLATANALSPTAVTADAHGGVHARNSGALATGMG